MGVTSSIQRSPASPAAQYYPIRNLEGKNDGHQVRFAEAIQALVGSDPDISFAVLKYGADNIVAQSIFGGE